MMIQDAVVHKIIDRHTAEVAVYRKTACGDGCTSCKAGCGQRQVIYVAAINRASAQVGERVMIESRGVLSASFWVYIFPLFLLILGYVLATASGVVEKAAVFIGIAAFLLGVLITVVLDRLVFRKKIEYTIKPYCN